MTQPGSVTSDFLCMSQDRVSEMIAAAHLCVRGEIRLKIIMLCLQGS